MNKVEFREQFGPNIRVNVDWKLFQQDDVTLVEPTLSLPRDSNRLWTPWFPGGASHHPADACAEPLSVLGAASDISLLGTHEPAIRSVMARIEECELFAPAVALPRGRYLLLDGNHHIVAAVLLELAVIVRLAAIVVPRGRNILVDIPALS